MCESMVDIPSATTENRRGKKKEKERRKKEETAGRKYNGLPYSTGGGIISTGNLLLLQTVCQAGPDNTSSTALEFWTLSVDFHQHATGRHVINNPVAMNVTVQYTFCTPSKPPAAEDPTAAASIPGIVVAVRSAEHPPVGVMICRLRRHRVAGVSAVPAHHQLVLTSLVSDSEHRVLSRVPQTARTLDLSTVTRNRRRGTVGCIRCRNNRQLCIFVTPTDVP